MMERVGNTRKLLKGRSFEFEPFFSLVLLKELEKWSHGLSFVFSVSKK